MNKNINIEFKSIIMINLFIGLTKNFRSSKKPRIKFIKPIKTKKVIFSSLKKYKKYIVITVNIISVPPKRAIA